MKVVEWINLWFLEEQWKVLHATFKKSMNNLVIKTLSELCDSYFIE